MQFGYITGRFLGLIGGNRPVVTLVVVFLLIGPLTIGLHYLSQVDLSGEPHRVLLEAPDPYILALVFGSVQSGAGLPRDLPAPIAAFFSADVGRWYLTISAHTLDDIYLFIVPIIMLLVGGSALPHDERIYGLFFSLPKRKTCLYLYHVLALSILISLLIGIACLLNLMMVCTLYRIDRATIGILAGYHIALGLFAFVFAFLGVALSALFRERSAALALGLVIVILLTAVIPPAQRVLSDIYVHTHRSELLAKAAAGESPTDPLFRLVDGLALTPSFAFRGTLEELAALYARGKNDGCTGCRATAVIRARIAERRLALLIAAGVLFLTGGVAFIHKEAKFT